MPELKITIGERDFAVACAQGEEHFLQAAAALLDAEAAVLLDQIGRMPEGRMLLMAGLMVADKAAGTGDRLRRLQAELEAAQGQIAALEAALAEARAHPVEVEVPVVPHEVFDTLAEIAARAEAMADAIEENA